MSQAKVDQYKKEKANRKKTLARNKMKKYAGITCAWLVVVAIVGWAGYEGYNYYIDNLPKETYYCQTTELDNYMSNLSNPDAE